MSNHSHTNGQVKFEVFSSKHMPLSYQFNCNPEKCSNPAHFRDYLSFNALLDSKQGMGLTFVLCEYTENEPSKIAGFITLKTSSLVEHLDRDEIQGYPALEVSELAVDKEREDLGIGTHLLEQAVCKCDEIRENFAAVKYLILCADEKAVGFYLRFGFEKIEDYYSIPREKWNDNCVPMYLKIANE